MAEVAKTYRGAPTLGWDLVYAVEIGQINSRIAAKHDAPTLFSASYGGTAEIRGELGTWRIVPGGSGSRVFLAALLQSATLTLNGKESAFSGTVTLSFGLEYLQTDAGHALRIRHDDGAEPVFDIEALSLQGVSGMMGTSIVKAALQQWLSAHDECFEHVFAVVQLDPLESDSAHAWLRPTSVSYAYADRPERGDGILAILAMTNDRSAGHKNQQVMASAIADDHSAAILISPHLLLDWIIRPALPQVYKGIRVEDIELKGDTPMLRLIAPRPITIEPPDHPPIRATLEFLTIAFNGTEFVCVSEMSVKTGTVIEHTRAHTRQVLRMGMNKDGRPAIVFQDVPPHDIREWKTVDPEVQDAANRAAEIILAVGMVAAFLVSGPFALTVMVIAVITAGVIKLAPTLATFLDFDHAPAVDLMVLNTTAPFAWHGGAEFALESVDLVDSLRLGGSPWPDTPTS